MAKRITTRKVTNPKRKNAAGPTFAQAMSQARSAGASIGDTSGFEPWLVRARLDKRGPLVRSKLKRQFWTGVETGEAPEAKESKGKTLIFHGIKVWKDAKGWRASSDPDSVFDSLPDVKRFVEAQAKNPSLKSFLIQKGAAIAQTLHPYEFGQPVSRYYILEKWKSQILGYDYMTIRGKREAEGCLYSGYLKEAKRILESAAGAKQWMQKRIDEQALENPQVTDRALRYRANSPERRPADPRECAFCGSNENVEVGHLDGHEENDDPRNLVWNCRSCNTRLGHIFKTLGIGRRTRQYNPGTQGAQSSEQYALAITAKDHGNLFMTAEAARDIIHATPPEDRSYYARRLWRVRYDKYGPSGRVSQNPDGGKAA
jgi:hypothetical protein